MSTSATGPGWTLHQGDALEGLRMLESVDVVITDPPYDEHVHAKGKRGSSTIHRGFREREASKRASISRNRDLGFAPLTAAQMATAADHFARLARRWVLVFCAVEMVSDWKRQLERAGLVYIRTCVWHKLGSTPQFTGDRPAQAVEAIVCAHRRGRTRWNAHGKHGYYAHPIVLDRGNGEVRLHTTQKPLALMRELVEDFTEPGELVLDAYAGSATTALACMQIGRGRTSIGWELDAATFETACRRLRGDEAKPRKEQPGLFDALTGTP